jgi:hypothetical protein
MVGLAVGTTVRINTTEIGHYHWSDRDRVGTIIQHVVTSGSLLASPEDYYIIMMPSGVRYKVPVTGVVRVTQEWVEVPNQEGQYHGKHRRTQAHRRST